MNQIAAFGDLLVTLTNYMDKAQRTIKRLTWVLTILTLILVVDAGIRWFVH